MVFFVLAAACVWVATALVAVPDADRVFPGVSVAGVDLSDKTADEARRALEQAVSEWNRSGVRVETAGKSTTVSGTISAVGDLDLTYELLSVDVDDTVRRALAVGHASISWRTILTRLHLLASTAVLLPTTHVDRGALIALLRENFAALEHPAENATLRLGPHGALAVVSERAGQSFPYAGAADAVIKAFQSFAHPIVTLALATDQPTIVASDAQQLIPRAEQLLSTLPKSVVVTDPSGAVLATITVDRSLVDSWFAVERHSDGSAHLALGSGIDAWLAQTAKVVEREPVDAKFVLESGRVTSFQESADGLRLDRAQSVAQLRQALLDGGTQSITLALVSVAPHVSIAAANALGIRELLGVGTSNFKGSPKNRRHNIATGVAKLNGVIIPAGQEFSLGNALGRIEEDTGYLPELVIKGDRTLPEFGGGLCQIGTTTFRAAMAAGLPITERQNHSYRVRYYEPAGTDATIYPPHPDLRFKNDTNNALVLVTKMDGDDLRFELWGTSDGRKAERTDPKISNIVKPPEMKIIESEDLKPGEKKCTEIAHNGADTVFAYTVTMPDGTKREQTFRSHYKPWQAVCLIGVTKKPEQQASTSQQQKAASELPPPPDIPRVTP